MQILQKNTTAPPAASLAHVAHDYLRYANVWEDADVLIAGLRPAPGSRIVSICSAGDNALALLTTDPERVVAVDVNAPQLFLTELKMAAIRRLPHTETLAFLGFRPAANRVRTYRLLTADLSTSARAFWETNLNVIADGIIHGGKFERYFRLFARRVLPLIHGRRTVEQLLALKPAAAQEEFYETRWNNRRWRALFRLFFSRRVMGWLGRDPAFLAQVEGSVGQQILERAARHLRQPLATENGFLRYALIGDFGAELPHYLQPGNYPIIRARLDRLELHHGYVQEVARRVGAVDAMNLSNIFEYLDPATFAATVRELDAAAAPDCRFAYWNLLVPRRMPEECGELRYLKSRSERLTRRDRGFFYGGFRVDQKFSV